MSTLRVGEVPVKPWNITRVCAPILRFPIVSSYPLYFADVLNDCLIARDDARGSRLRIMVNLILLFQKEEEKFIQSKL